jgi:RNA polymerase sigma-70 factor (ECF subfamily)
MTFDRTDLAVLLTRVATGDRAAFSALYRAAAPKLLGVILRILNRRDLAEEVLQEVFVRIWDRAGDFDAGAGAPLAWLSTIARNRALDSLRRRRETSIEDEPAAFEVPDAADDPAVQAERSADLKRLMGCLETLDEDKRRMVLLAYHQGLSRDELAARFNVPVGTVKTWLHRSLARLKECLGE